MGDNEGNIWTKYGQDMGNTGPIWNGWTKTVWGPDGRKGGQDLGKMLAGSGTHMGNPHGTHMEQVDKNRIGDHEGNVWAGTGTHMGNPRGAHIKQVDKNRMGPRWAGKIWGKCGQDLGPIWAIHMKQMDKNHMGDNEGNICAKCGQDLGPIWATHVGPILNRWIKTV